MPATEFEEDSRRKRWHNSTLSDLEGCPRLFAANYLLDITPRPKLQTFAGTCYHAALELHELARLAGATLPELDDLIDHAIDDLDTMLRGVTDAQLEKYVTNPAVRARNPLRGRAALVAEVTTALTGFYTAPTKTDTGLDGPTLREFLLTLTPVSIETYAASTYVPGARELGGTWDGLYLDPDGNPVVVDHKSATSFGQIYTPEAPGLTRQMTIYVTLVMLTGLVTTWPRSIALVAVRRQNLRASTEAARIIEIAVSPHDLTDLRARILAGEDAMAEGSFPRNPAYQHCVRCPFADRCEDNPEGVLRLPMPVLMHRLGPAH